jgi:sugar/nucleoside kinase (ribokinase family)
MPGIACAGNWIIDNIKIVDHWPEQGTVTNICSEDTGPGGSPFNVSIGLHQLGIKDPIYGLGCIGKDKLGAEIKDICKTYHIDHSHLKELSDTATSYTIVIVIEEDGSRTFFHQRGANAKFSEQDVDINKLVKLGVRHFHLGNLLILDTLDAPNKRYKTNAAQLLADIKSAGLTTSIDVITTSEKEKSRFHEVVAPALPYVDYLVINEIEAAGVAQTELRRTDNTLNTDNLLPTAQVLIDMGVQQAAVIHYPEGGFWFSKDGQQLSQKAFTLPEKDVVSTDGCGDAFCSGILYGVYHDFDPQRCLEIATANAASCATAANTVDGLRSYDELKKLLK